MSLRQSSRPRTERIDSDDYSAAGLFQACAGGAFRVLCKPFPAPGLLQDVDEIGLNTRLPLFCETPYVESSYEPVIVVDSVIRLADDGMRSLW